MPLTEEIARAFLATPSTLARRTARTSPTGDLVLLEDQDRSLWNKDRWTRAPPPIEYNYRRKAELEARRVPNLMKGEGTA